MEFEVDAVDSSTFLLRTGLVVLRFLLVRIDFILAVPVLEVLVLEDVLLGLAFSPLSGTWIRTLFAMPDHLLVPYCDWLHAGEL